MPVEEYAAQPFVQENELFDFIAKICLSKLDGNYTGLSNVLTCTSSGKKTYLYFNNRDASHLLASKQEQAQHEAWFVRLHDYLLPSVPETRF